jgi:hypothetical protein
MPDQSVAGRHGNSPTRQGDALPSGPPVRSREHLPASGEEHSELQRVQANQGQATTQRVANLYQRISAITAAVGPVEATSKTAATAGGKKAVGIEDVEEALGPLLALHGVVTEWTSSAPPERIQLPARDGTFDVWMVRLRVRLINADSPDDRMDWADWADIGSNPIAASSFARKAFYKALFHIAAAEDEGKPAARDQGTTPAAAKPRNIPIAHACPECGEGLAIVTTRTGSRFIGHSKWVQDGCKWSADQRQRDEWIGEAEGAEAVQGDDATERGEVTLAELVQRAGHRIADFAKLDAESCKAIVKKHGWDGEMKSVDWLRTITETMPLVALLSDLNEAVELYSGDIPF